MLKKNQSVGIAVQTKRNAGCLFENFFLQSNYCSAICQSALTNRHVIFNVVNIYYGINRIYR